MPPTTQVPPFLILLLYYIIRIHVYTILTILMDQDRGLYALSSEPDIQSSFVGKALSEK